MLLKKRMSHVRLISNSTCLRSMQLSIDGHENYFVAVMQGSSSESIDQGSNEKVYDSQPANRIPNVVGQRS